MENPETLFSLPWYKIGFAKVPVSAQAEVLDDPEKGTGSEHDEYISAEGKRDV